MEQSYIDNFKRSLGKYVPASAVEPLFDFLAQHKVHLHITRERFSKLGDYRWPQHQHRYHEISVNGNLNCYHFLQVMLHEMGHLNTFLQYGTAVQPHGHEWQAAYARLLMQYRNCFPAELHPLLTAYTQRIPLSRTLEKEFDAQLFFQSLYVLGDGGLRNVMQFTGLCKTECFCCSDKVFQLISSQFRPLSTSNRAGGTCRILSLQSFGGCHYFNIIP